LLEFVAYNRRMSTPDQQERLANPELLPEWQVGLIANGILCMAMIKKPRVYGREHLRAAAEHVNNHDGGLFVIANHTSMWDAMLTLLIRQKINPGIPVGMYWANKFVNADSGTADADPKELQKMQRIGQIGQLLARKSGVMLLPVPQEAVWDKQVMTKARAVIEAGRDMMQEEKGAVVGFPEGTRSKTGFMMPAVDAVVNQMTKSGGKASWVMPAGIVGANRVLPRDNKSFNVFAQMIIRFGQPISANELHQGQERHGWSIGTEAMYQVAPLIPQEMWGVYSNQFLHMLSEEER
jgi:1-acyl-sn-glycerol-3-phosphate acyltransferase